MGDGMGEVGNTKMPSGSSGKKLGSCLSDKMLTVVLQLFFFLFFFLAPSEKHPVYDVKPLLTALPHLPLSPSDYWQPHETYF